MRLDGLPVRACQALPGIDTAALEATGSSPANVLTHEDLESGDAIRAFFRRLTGTQSAQPITDIQERVARGILRPEIITGQRPRPILDSLCFVLPRLPRTKSFAFSIGTRSASARHLGAGYHVIKGCRWEREDASSYVSRQVSRRVLPQSQSIDSVLQQGSFNGACQGSRRVPRMWKSRQLTPSRTQSRGRPRLAARARGPILRRPREGRTSGEATARWFEVRHRFSG